MSQLLGPALSITLGAQLGRVLGIGGIDGIGRGEAGAAKSADDQ